MEISCNDQLYLNRRDNICAPGLAGGACQNKTKQHYKHHLHLIARSFGSGAAHQPVDVMVDGFALTKDGQLDPNELAKWVRQATRMGLTGEDAAKLAAYKSVSSTSVQC